MVAAILEGESSAASAHRRLSRVMQEYRATGARQALPYAYGRLAQMSLRVGEPRRAKAEIEQGLACARRTRLVLFVPELLRVTGLVHRALGDRDRARTALTSAMTRARRMRARLFERRIARLFAGEMPGGPAAPH